LVLKRYVLSRLIAFAPCNTHKTLSPPLLLRSCERGVTLSQGSLSFLQSGLFLFEDADIVCQKLFDP
jgi:hypothetical protein